MMMVLAAGNEIVRERGWQTKTFTRTISAQIADPDVAKAGGRRALEFIASEAYRPGGRGKNAGGAGHEFVLTIAADAGNADAFARADVEVDGAQTLKAHGVARLKSTYRK